MKRIKGISLLMIIVLFIVCFTGCKETADSKNFGYDLGEYILDEFFYTDDYYEDESVYIGDDIVDINDAYEGSYIVFGEYEQDGDESNGKEK